MILELIIFTITAVGLYLCCSTRPVEAAHRPTTLAPHGMVVTPHYLASQTAVNLLKNGANAIEAAIAAASVISVVYPHMNSIGGDNFWLIYDAQSKKLRALNASGRAGELATIDHYKSLGYTAIPPRGYLSANTVPGAVSGWHQAYEYSKNYLQGRYAWADLLSDAIDYADQGFPVTPSQEYWTQVNINTADPTFRGLQQYPGFKKTFLTSQGTPYQTGSLFTQKDLAQTLNLIAHNGANEFYQGEIARKIAAELQEQGGLLTKKDFARHHADWVSPISVPYRDCVAYNLPPNTQGMASLSILNILDNYDLSTIGQGTADYYHLIIEATKQAFADRDRWITDPDFVKAPIDKLLSKQHGTKLAERIHLRQAATLIGPLDPKGDTIWLGVVDQAGNAVSLIQSIYYDFGSGIISAGTGITLQNRGSFFSLDRDHINRLEPGKRTFHTLNPAMLLKSGKPYLVYGTMGGEGQPQTQAAIVTRIIDFGFPVQDAIEAPRWLYGRTWGTSTNDLKVEKRVPTAVVEELIRRGHPVRLVEEYTDTMGHAGAILIDPAKQVKHGGADPRGDGAALGY